VAQVCNPRYTGGRDQEGHTLKPALASSSQDPVSKNPISKNWAGVVTQGEGPEFKSQYRQKKKSLQFDCHINLKWIPVKKSPQFNNS
jgi:hypothetical protein